MKYEKIGKNVELGIKPAKPLFGYYGSKNRISKSIINELPPHNAWVEVFCGSGAITLAKQPSQIEIINDLDAVITNLFGQLRDNGEKLIEAIYLTPYSRAEFEKAKKINVEDGELEKARKFLINCMMTINGTSGVSKCGFSFSNTYSRGRNEARVNRWNGLLLKLDDVVARLKNVRIENIDARKLLKMFEDRPATLLYLDPPYLTKRYHSYSIDQRTEEFHEELLDLCCKSKAMIIISGYKNDLYTRKLKKQDGWEVKKINSTTRGTNGKDIYREEIIWINSKSKKAKNSNRVPIRLARKEKELGKINPKR